MLSIGLIFWILYIVGFIFYAVRDREAIVNSAFWWVLFLLLGIGTFGWPIR